MSRILTAVAVVVDRTQFPPSDRVQILPESTVPRKNLYKFERKWFRAAALFIRNGSQEWPHATRIPFRMGADNRCLLGSHTSADKLQPALPSKNLTRVFRPEPTPPRSTRFKYICTYFFFLNTYTKHRNSKTKFANYASSWSDPRIESEKSSTAVSYATMAPPKQSKVKYLHLISWNMDEQSIEPYVVLLLRWVTKRNMPKDLQVITVRESMRLLLSYVFPQCI